MCTRGAHYMTTDCVYHSNLLICIFIIFLSSLKSTAENEANPQSGENTKECERKNIKIKPDDAFMGNEN